MIKKIAAKLTYVQIIILGFLFVIFLGTVLLLLPISSKNGFKTSFADAMLTATSASCVTGLTPFDTYTHWSLFGQVVILILIQIGGIGLMSIIAMFGMFFGKKIGVYERKILMNSTGSTALKGIIKLLRKILLGTFAFEGVGSLVLFSRFYKTMGIKEGLYNAVFHSVSAFCNAGFDLMGKYSPSSSVTLFYNDSVIIITLSLLIIIGGLGFIVWDDFINNRFKFSGYQLHSKVVLSVTAILMISSTVLFYIFEKDAAFAGMTFNEKILSSFFQAATTRTAGFNSVDLNTLSQSGNILTVVLMFIGASPGSTGGGIKTTTFAVIILSVLSLNSHHSDIVIFKRKISDTAVKQASSVLSVYLMSVIIASLIICYIEPFGIKEVVFETTSAIGTVGLTLGITSKLKNVSKIVITVLMFFGRIGGLSVALMFTGRKPIVALERPEGKILIG